MTKKEMIRIIQETEAEAYKALLSAKERQGGESKAYRKKRLLWKSIYKLTIKLNIEDIEG
jgi:hypothetical protein